MSTKKAQPQKHVPLRTCIATGEKLPKKELVRLVKTADGKVAVDAWNKIKGRGANIKPTIDAFDLAVKKNAISRALKLEQPLTGTELAELKAKFMDVIAEKQFRPDNKPVKIKLKPKTE